MKSKVGRGEGILGLLNYIFRRGKAGTAAACPTILSTNLSGVSPSPREMSREIRAVTLLKPNVKRPLMHISLSLVEGEKLDGDTWRRLIQRYIKKMGFPPDTLFVSALHHDTKCQHAHVALSRISLSGKVWLGRWEARRSISVCQELEKEFGLRLTPGLHGNDDADAKAKRPDRVADSQSVVNANRAKGARRIDTAEMAHILLKCAARSTDLPSFTLAAAALGIKVLPNKSETTGYVSGLSIVPPGRKKPLALGDATGKVLTWPKLLKIFAQADAARDAAQFAARAAVAAADRLAAAQVEARLDRVEGTASATATDPQPALALPVASTKAKEAITMDDDLAFLNPNPPPPPRPPGAPVPEAAAGDLTAHELRERDETEFLRSLRAMSILQLLDLRRLDVPPLVLSAAAIENMLNLVLKLLSFGLVRRVGGIESAIAARKRLQELAEGELARRRRTPQSQSAKRAALAEHVAALKKREVGLVERASARTMPDGHAHEHAAARRATLFKENEAGFDRLQTSRHLPTIKTRRAELAAAARAEKAIEDEVPVAMGMIMLPRARVAALAARADRAARLRAAAARRQAAAAALQAYLDQVEAAVAAHIAADAAAAAAKVARDEDEKKLIATELKELAPEILAARNAHERDRVGQAARGFIEDAEAPPRGESDLEAERAALRRALGKVA